MLNQYWNKFSTRFRRDVSFLSWHLCLHHFARMVWNDTVWLALSVHWTVTVMVFIEFPVSSAILYRLEKMVPEIVPSLCCPLFKSEWVYERFFRYSNLSWANVLAWVILLPKLPPFTELICITAIPRRPMAKMSRPIRISMSVNPFWFNLCSFILALFPGIVGQLLTLSNSIPISFWFNNTLKFKINFRYASIFFTKNISKNCHFLLLFRSTSRKNYNIHDGIRSSCSASSLNAGAFTFPNIFL